MKSSTLLMSKKWFVFAFLFGITRMVFGKVNLTTQKMSISDFDRLMAAEGIYEEGKNYNVKINGFGTGLQPPTMEQWEKMRELPVMLQVKSVKTIPDSHDNSALPWFPPIGNQDGEGSCVAWATGYYTKTFQEAFEHGWDLSACTWDGGYYGYPSEGYQDKTFSPDFIYHQINRGVDNGLYYSDAMNLLENIGCCTWENMPYDPTDTTTWPEEAAWREAPLYRSATGYGRLWVDTDTGIEALKQVLADTNLAIIGIDANKYSALTMSDLWTTDSYVDVSSNHANTIVGYDNNYGPYTENDETRYGAFKVANSWGTDNWENEADGFYYISYECMKTVIQYVFLYENLIAYEPQILAVFNIDHDLRGECEIEFGIGGYASPLEIKKFNNELNKNGGNHPFPANDIVLDITEFVSSMSGSGDIFYMSVYDTATIELGILDKFEIEQYSSYESSGLTATYTSDDVPVNTEHYNPVLATIGTAPFPTHTIGFESARDGTGWEWAVVENDDNPPLEFVANPNASSPNASSTVAKFTARQTGANWALCLTQNDGEFTFNTSNSTVKMMVYKSVVSNVGFKVEGSTGTVTELKVPNTVTDAWEELTFDFSSVIGQSYNQLVIYPDWVEPYGDGTDRTQENIVYFDNIQVPDGELSYSISGNLLYAESGVPLVGDTLSLSGDAELIAVTGETGAYQFDLNTGNVTVTPEKHDELEGIDGLDLLRLKNSLLEVTTLTSAATAAADCNGSGDVNGLDLLRLKNYLLMIPVDPPIATWGFVPDHIDYQPLSSDMTDQNYEGFVYGDVDLSWGSGGSKGAQYTHSVRIDNYYLDDQERLHVPVYLSENARLAMLNWHIAYDRSAFEYENLISDFIDQSSVNNTDNIIHLMWVYNGQETEIEKGKSLCELVLKPKEGKSGGMIGFKGKNLAAHADESLMQTEYNDIYIDLNMTGLAEGLPVPSKTTLYSNYPNPFNPTTKIHYYLKDASRVSLAIYNLRGETVREYVYPQQKSGFYQVIWNGCDNSGTLVSTGIYFYRIQYENGTQVKRMLLMK